MRIKLLPLLILSCGMSASAANVVDFVIVNSSSLSASGGVFTSGGGGTFSGSFQVDVSQIPPGGSRTQFPLTSWDIFITGPPQLGFNMEFNPSNGSASFVAQTEQSFAGLGPNPDFLQTDSVIFQRIVGQDVFQLILSMLEPAGFFRGGVVLEAVDTDTNFGVPQSQTSMSDLLGTGLVVDPAILAPEPGCGLLLAAGLGLIAAGRRRRSK
jgi:MYXO-CTERM domain-containing protein